MKLRNNNHCALIADVLCISLIITSSGCAASGWRSKTPEELRRQVRSVAVVPSASAPKNSYDPAFAKGKDEGATKGALRGMGDGLRGSLEFAAKLNIVGLLLLPITLPAFLGMGADKGRQEGIDRAVPTEEVQKIDALLAEINSNMNIQEIFAKHLISKGAGMTEHRFRYVMGPGSPSQPENSDQARICSIDADMTIETAVSNFGFMGGEGQNPSVSLFVDNEVRVKSPWGGGELYRKPLRYLSQAKTLDQWTQDGASLLKQELETAFASLAERSMEDLFFVRDFYKGERRCFALDDSGRTLIVWEAFPGRKDRESDQEGASERVSDITYDVRFFRARARQLDLPHADVVYGERELSELIVRDVSAVERSRELSVTENYVNSIGQVVDTLTTRTTILTAEPSKEIQLDPNASYFCSIRAKYKLDKQTRLTQWSPYYKFTTPKQDVPQEEEEESEQTASTKVKL